MSERRCTDSCRKLCKVDKPRRIAHDVLHEAEAQGVFANIILSKALRQTQRDGRFSDRDATFISGLVHDMLHAIDRLGWVISRYIDRPLTDLDPRMLIVLRTGIYQLLDMRVPDHAAMSATVDVAREHLMDGPVRFVNAVLRSVTCEDPSECEVAMDATTDEDQALGARYLHPTWMVTAFHDALKAHSYPEGGLLDVLEADNEVLTVTLVTRLSLMSVDELADEAEDILDTRVVLGAISPYAALLEPGNPTCLPSTRDGRAGAQDEDSQFATLITASAPPEGGNDERQLDPCTGPGGRAVLLAGLAAGARAHVTANEVCPHHVRLVGHTTRQFDSIEVVSGNGCILGDGQNAWPLGSLDRVVIDTPCSGMGSTCRRPESRWNYTPAGVEELTVLQRELLDQAAALTRPGGVLICVTCSPYTTETREQVECLFKVDEVKLLDTVTLTDECAPQAPDVLVPAGVIKGLDGRMLQLWGHHSGTDLMFVAYLHRC